MNLQGVAGQCKHLCGDKCFMSGYSCQGRTQSSKPENLKETIFQMITSTLNYNLFKSNESGLGDIVVFPFFFLSNYNGIIHTPILISYTPLVILYPLNLFNSLDLTVGY